MSINDTKLSKQREKKKAELRKPNIRGLHFQVYVLE